MPKWLQLLVGFVVLVLVVATVILFFQVRSLEKRVAVAETEADSLYSWVYRADPLWTPRWQLIHANFDSLRALHRLPPLPPWGSVPPAPPSCVPPEPCPPGGEE